MGAVVALAPRSAAASERPSLPMRLALGYLHFGPLFMSGPRKATAQVGTWRSRERAEAAIADQTIEALERRGWAQATSYEGANETRWCAMLTAAGESAYAQAGGMHARLPRLPAPAEVTIERFDEALAAIREEFTELAAIAARIGPRIIQARDEITLAIRDNERITARIATLTRLAGSLGERRDAVRTLLLERRR
ncbi:hypothetical protein LJR090_002526 [Bosea sp. LjRoot90]|uniref:hypothetical protein n=1 Tax=Bosea sp. LjRoot90 TaxID=3342342 RepID=UPI003ECCCA3E